MSTNVTVLPGTLPAGYCYPPDPQTLNVDIVSRIVAFIASSLTGVYASPTAPPVDEQDKVWFNTNVQRSYWFINGAWQRQYLPAANSHKIVMIETDIDTFNAEEGGDPVAVGVGPYTGPLWTLATEYAGSVPIGVGLIPGTNPAVSIAAVGDTHDTAVPPVTGAYNHLLTGDEGGIADHVHAFGLSYTDGSDTAFWLRRMGLITVPSFSGVSTHGTGTNVHDQTTADMFTLPVQQPAGVTQTPLNLMQPYRAVNFARRSARIYVPSPF